MGFRNFKDIIRYVTGEWDRQNSIITKHEKNADKALQKIADECNDDNYLMELVADYADEVYCLGLMSGVRFGEKEVYKIVENPGYRPKI